MTGHLAVAAPKIGKYLRLLASDKPGEVLSAVAAIDRALTAAGADWHTLADAVEIGLEGRHHRQAERMPKVWQQLARELIRRSGGRLRRAEVEFLRSMSTWPFEPSGKQLRWLKAIAAALRDDEAA